MDVSDTPLDFNPNDLTISETLLVLQKNWVNRFRKEEYDEVADEIEKMGGEMLHRLKDTPTIEHLKKKAPNRHCKVYLEAMQGDFEAKLLGHHKESVQRRLE